jgi:conjugative transfer signal peptidase TraF
MTGLEAWRLSVRLAVLTALASVFSCMLAAHLLWNCTPSLPLGLYWLSRGAPPARGTLVAFAVPADVAALVHERRYLPPRAMLVKAVVATAGDRVCTDGGVFTVNEQPIEGGGRIATEDSAGRPLPHYEGCDVAAEGLLFVASHYPKSFDSRTFGPVPLSDLRGTVTPLWTF